MCRMPSFASFPLTTRRLHELCPPRLCSHFVGGEPRLTERTSPRRSQVHEFCGNRKAQTLAKRPEHVMFAGGSSGYFRYMRILLNSNLIQRLGAHPLQRLSENGPISA